MDDFFTPVSQTYLKPRPENAALSASHSGRSTQAQREAPSVSSLEDAVEHLKSQPDYDSLISTLSFLRKGNQLSAPSPSTAQIVQLLVSDIVPNYWPLLQHGSAEDRVLMLDCLRNITGINALLARLKVLILESKASEKDAKRPDITLGLETLLQVLATTLDGDDSLSSLWHNLHSQAGALTTTRVLKQEFLSLFASSGKIVSLAAEADAIVSREQGTRKDHVWITDGLAYTRWIGRSIAAWIGGDGSSPEDDAICSDIFARALRLGYGGKLTSSSTHSHAYLTYVLEHLIKQMIQDLLLGAGGRIRHFLRLFGNLSQLEQKRVLYAVLKHLADNFLNKLETADTPEASAVVSGSAGVIEQLLGNDDSRRNHLVIWLTSATGAGVGDSVGIRRAALAAIAKNREVISTVLDKSLNLFGDELYIKHSPILQQEGRNQPVIPWTSCTDVVCSTCSGRPVERWTRPAQLSPQGQDAYKVWRVSPGRLQSLGCIPDESEGFGNDHRRGNLLIIRHQARLQDGRA